MVWTCDFKGCDEIAQWYRKKKGKLFKLCTTHEAHLNRMHWGRRVDLSELNEDDIRYLERKERRKELAKKEPFEIETWLPLEDGTTKVSIRDRRTDERHSLMIEDTDLKKLFDILSSYDYREMRKSFTKLSIDEFVEKLRKNLFTKTSEKSYRKEEP